MNNDKPMYPAAVRLSRSADGQSDRPTVWSTSLRFASRR